MTNEMIFPGQFPLRDTTVHPHTGRNFKSRDKNT